MLLEHGADPFILSNLDANILHAAAESKTAGALNEALDIYRRHPHRLDINQPNHWGETPLHVAAWGSIENVRKLVHAGADCGARQEDNQVPLHCTGQTAAPDVRHQIIPLLCKDDPAGHINTQDNDGRPPLFDYLDDAKSVKMLIDYGAHLGLLDNEGKTAFHHACMQDQPRTLKTLLSLSTPNSIIVTVKDHDGNTPLIHALKCQSRECALELLKLDDVGDVVGQHGWAAIHHAAKFGDLQVLEQVVGHQSFVGGVKTIEGMTAEGVAMEAGTWSGDVKALLRRCCAVS